MAGYKKSHKYRGKNPETIIQTGIIKMLEAKGWYVKRMGASAFLSGFPDLFCYHQVHKLRLIEVKTPTGSFEASQEKEFTKMARSSCGVWVLIAATPKEYNKLFKEPNWYTFLPHMRALR